MKCFTRTSFYRSQKQWHMKHCSYSQQNMINAKAASSRRIFWLVQSHDVVAQKSLKGSCQNNVEHVVQAVINLQLLADLCVSLGGEKPFVAWIEASTMWPLKSRCSEQWRNLRYQRLRAYICRSSLVAGCFTIHAVAFQCYAFLV